MSLSDSPPNGPREPDVIPGTYVPPPEDQESILLAVNVICERSKGYDHLFRYNLTLEGLNKLAKEGAAQMLDLEGKHLMRILYVEQNKKRFAIVWPGGLAFHDQVEDALTQALGKVYARGGSIPMDVDASGTFTFTFERLKNEARVIEYQTRPY